jgi:acetylornithine/succinyldiaminopimelate/putrescine aminotransferase
VAATGNPHYQEGFEPLPAGFKFVPYNDLAAAKAAITPSVCAFLMEPAQGEGGVVPATREYLQGLQALCREHDLLLILDEVQSGIGRTGTLFAYEQFGVSPDVVTLAKGLGGGVPIGAVLARDSVAAHLVPGTHGTTFGGNPLATAAAAAVLETIQKEGILENVKARGAQLVDGLRRLGDRHGVIAEVRGMGLWIGVDLTIDAGPLVEACSSRGLLINAVRPKTLRIAPPLVATEADVDAALRILDEAIAARIAVPAAAGETPR